MKLFCFIALASSWFVSPVWAQAGAAAKEIPVEELLGRWRSEDGGTQLEIEQLYYKDPTQKNAVGARGRFDWGGLYSPEKKQVHFRRNPKWEEINPAAPEWARKQVEGKLTWELEFDVSGCGFPKLEGNFYPGEIEWKQDKAGQPISEAKVVPGRGQPRKVVLRRETEADKKSEPWQNTPLIIVRSERRPMNDGVIDSLHREEPFYIEVRLSEERAAGRDAIVVKLATSSGATNDLRLKKNGGRRYVRYDTLQPLTLRRGGSPVVDQSTTDHAFSANTMPGLDINPGDTVTISFEGAEAQFKAFVHPIQQQLYRLDVSLSNQILLNNTLSNDSALPENDRRVASTKARLLQNAKSLTQTLKSDHQKLAVAVETLRYVNDAATWQTPPVPMVLGGALQSDPRFPEVNYYSQVEKNLIDRALQQGAQDYYDRLVRTAQEASDDIVLFFIGTTGADSFYILCSGLDLSGERVDSTQRIFAGISVGSQALLDFGVSGLQYMKMVRQSETAALVFEKSVLKNLEKTVRIDAKVAQNAAGAGSRGLASSRRSSALGAGGSAGASDPGIPVHEEYSLAGARRKGKPGGYLLQRTDDTCGMMVAEQMRRDVGESPRSEAYSIELAEERTKTYKPREGLSVGELATIIAADGADVRIPRKATLASIEQELIAENKVAVMINTKPPTEPPRFHWVEVKEFEHGADGSHIVVFGDPWNGNIWEVDSCTFMMAMEDQCTVVAKWGKQTGGADPLPPKPGAGGAKGGGSGPAPPPRRPLGRRSTTARWERGTTLPRNVREQMAIEDCITHPEKGTIITDITMHHPWPASEGWVKMERVFFEDPTRKNSHIIVHYVRNVRTGEIDDFKIVISGNREPVPPGLPR